jgi:hypothetical protein
MRKTSVLAIIALLCLAVAAGAVAQGSGDPPSSAPEGQPDPKVNKEKTERPVPVMSGRFGAFRRGRQGRDALPVRIATAVDASEWLGANSTLARRVAEKDGDAIHLVPTADGACVVTTRGGFACGPADYALQGGLVLAEACVPGLAIGALRLVGASPDDARSVTVVNADGSEREIAVEDNAWVADFDRTDPARLPVEIRQAGGAGTPLSVPAPVPPDVSTVVCAGS